MGLQRVLWEVKGGPHRGAFLLERRANTRLIKVCRRKKKVVGKGHIVALEETGSQYCFGEAKGRRVEGGSLLAYKIESKCPRLVVLFDSLSE